jgi:hypothetical protein
MPSRRCFVRSGVAAAAMLAGLGAAGCASSPFLSELQLSRGDVVPDGSGVHDEADIFYTLTKRAEVSATVIGPDGTRYDLRKPQLRAPDRYMIPFRGLVPVANQDWLRVVPDGTYRVLVTAKDAGGAVLTREASIVVKNADTTAPEIHSVFVNPPTFSPNGDGIDDTVRVSYQLTKASQVRVYATDAGGGFYLIEATNDKRAADQGFEWQGTVAGGTTVLPDGKYVIHIEAADTAGNFTDATAPVEIQLGGTPRIEITDVKFAPTSLAYGMDLNVRITVKNTGTVPVRTLGPAPGTRYTTDMNFSSFLDPADPSRALYFERAGVWRVGVSWQNAPQAYPVRWGFFEDLNRQLQPGESATIAGSIQILIRTQNTQVFYAGLERGGVGFPGGQVGLTQVTISF